MWSIGLELALLIEDPWKIFLTTDHPNGAPFTVYPTIISWLTSRKARERTLKRISKRARKRSLLPSIDREYSLYEIAVVTRAGQAKALGLRDKGHLGVGADADVAIFRIDPEKTDASGDYRSVRKAFRKTAYTIKGGEIVAEDGVIAKTSNGRTIWTDLEVSSCVEAASCPKVLQDLKKRFSEYWTVQIENYFIPERYLENSAPIPVRSEV